MSDKMASDMRAAIAALGVAPSPHDRSVTSDLTIDETLLLHGMGYEPVDLVTGFSTVTIPYGTFIVPYGQGGPVALANATEAVARAFRSSSERLRKECETANGVGVVGVEVEVEINGPSATVAFTGTAVRPIGHDPETLGRPFVTDLSVRDFVLLERAGWAPIDLVAGAGFVAAPVQGVRQKLAQVGQNIELPVITRALQIAREQAMDQMQTAALAMSAAGVVDVTIIDGPLGHSRHVCAFICYGTAIRLVAAQHLRIEPDLVLAVDDHIDFQASSVH